MLNEAERKHAVRDLPQFFETDSVLLRPACRIETVPSDRPLRQPSSRALREEDIFAEKLHPACESRLRKTVAANAHVARRDADHLPLVAVQELGRRKPRVDLNTKRLGAGTEPTHNSAQRADEIAVIAHQFRHGPTGQSQPSRLGQTIKLILRHPSFERALRISSPVGRELIQSNRIDYSS